MSLDSQLERLRYSPHFEYVKELIFSEGIKEELPSWMIERINHSPSAVVQQLRKNKEDLSRLLDTLRQRLQPVEGFEAYEAWLSQGMPDEADVDWQALEEGPKRADILLFRLLLQTYQATDMSERILVHLGGEPDPEAERLEIRRWVAEESERRRLRQDIDTILPRLVDGVTTDYDRQYAEATSRFNELEHIQQVRERQLAGRMAIAFAPGAQAVRQHIPTMQEMVHGGLVYQFKGDPTPLLNALLKALFENATALTAVADGVRTLLKAMRMAANVRALIARQTVNLATSAFLQPGRHLLNEVASQLSSIQKEIFWPIFAILELLSGDEAAIQDEHTAQISAFAQSLLQLLENLDEGISEIIKEAKRFDRRLTDGVAQSLGQIELLQRIEAYATMFEQLLLQIDNLPIDLTKPSERRRLVASLVEGQGWRKTKAPSEEADEEAAADSAQSKPEVVQDTD